VSDFDVNNKISKEKKKYSNDQALYSEKERNACDTGFNLKHEKVSKRNFRARGIESCMFEFKGMRDIDVRSLSASTSWGIPQRSIAFVLSLSLYAGHPEYPSGK
jgi:hypothetical protein